MTVKPAFDCETINFLFFTVTILKEIELFYIYAGIQLL